MKTLTAEEIERAWVRYGFIEDSHMRVIFDQAKRVPELEAAAQEHLRFCTSASRDRRALREVLAAVVEAK